jgi:tRNA-specific 2-thiouridylase
MRINSQVDGGCSSTRDAEDVRRVADKLGIELHELDMGSHFKEIIAYFVSEYAAGRTPNPCVMCNRKFKFGKLINLADSLGIPKLATGHYARRSVYADGSPVVARGANFKKDQSYVLFAIDPAVVGRIVLPIGEQMDKTLVRELALEIGLDVHDKPDSQEICFVQDDDYVQLVREIAPHALKPGRILDTAGNELGRHDGYAKYTIGQRRGLGVAAGVPMYVVKIDPESADVTIGTREESMGRELTATGSNWHVRPQAEQFRANVQIRYNHRGAPATVTLDGDNSFRVEFDDAVHAITPGQAAVIYDGEFMLGGGFICS